MAHTHPMASLPIHSAAKVRVMMSEPCSSAYDAKARSFYFIVSFPKSQVPYS